MFATEFEYGKGNKTADKLVFAPNFMNCSCLSERLRTFGANNDTVTWPCGLTDKASDFESEDCRFESCHGRIFL